MFERGSELGVRGRIEVPHVDLQYGAPTTWAALLAGSIGRAAYR